MYQQLTDKALVRQYQRNNQGAFEELVRRHHQRLYRLAAVHLIDSDSAGDVTQEVFMRSLAGFKSFLFLAEPGTWLYQTTKNVCREFNRDRARHGNGGNQLKESVEGALVNEPYEDEVMPKETVKQVRQLVKELPERQRDVVMLRIFEGLSVEASATIMRCRPGTVKALLHRAMQALRTTAKDVELK